MLIREASEIDIPELIKLLACMDEDQEVIKIDTAMTIWEKTKQYPYYKVLVVEHDKRVIGTCSLIIIDNLGHRGKKVAVIESFIIDQEYRAKGIGKLLMQRVLELAESQNCYKLMLSSNKKRVIAHRFYEKLGFKQHGISFMIEVKEND